MKIRDDWPEIRHLTARALYGSIATVDETGHPHVAPIGSLVLGRQPGCGFWLEKFTAATPRHLERDRRLCVMVVDTRVSFWLSALVRGRFPRPPAIRLVGVAGPRRPATDQELECFRRRVRWLRWTRGHRLLWRDMACGRDVVFERILPIRLGAMWPPKPMEALARPAVN